MKLTIDNLTGAGETDYSAQLDAGAPPKIVRKLNQPPILTVWLACRGSSIPASAGSKVRLYRDSGELWFSGYLEDAPQLEFAGEAMGKPVWSAAAGGCQWRTRRPHLVRWRAYDGAGRGGRTHAHRGRSRIFAAVVEAGRECSGGQRHHHHWPD
jgi:hypothetical protein